MEKVFLSQRKERRKKEKNSRREKIILCSGDVAADAKLDWVSGLILQEVRADWLVNESQYIVRIE